MTSPSQFRPGPPPAADERAVREGLQRGEGEGFDVSHPATGTCPAPADTDMARFWSGNFGAQWNQVARDIAIDRQLGIGDTARLLALVNLAGADAGIAVWDSKVYYNFWRPITAIQTAPTTATARRPGMRAGCRSSAARIFRRAPKHRRTRITCRARTG